MEEINKKYISIIYTASHQIYADAVINHFDPNKKLISHRLYRNNCIQTKIGEEQIYVKDLRVLYGVDLSEVIIIDNCILSFVFQMDNGIPILPYYDNKNDRELIFLMKYLDYLAQYKDIKNENKRMIPLENFKQRVCGEDDDSSNSSTYDFSNHFR